MTVQAETVFEVIFAQLVERQKNLVHLVNGYVSFVVTGEQEGIWTMDLRKKGKANVFKGKVNKPVLIITIADDYLENFLTGNVDPKWAVQNDKLGVVGSRQKVNAFATFMGGATGVGLRAALVTQS